MTIFIADIASYQRGLTPAALLDAGFTGVNVKCSHGLSMKSVATDAADWLADSRFDHSTFHWLTKTDSGEKQARYAYARMVEMGADRVGYAHVVDVEETGVSGVQYSDYVVTMQSLLGRPIATYTGDWYWPKAWKGANISPWLHAAPNGGYLRSYPGDDTQWWVAGYGGWTHMAILQYAVEKVDGIAVSMSAVRDLALWYEMRGLVATSQNGWPVVSQNAVVERTIGGARIVNGWLRGDVDTIFTDLATWLDKEIEPSMTPGCWGHNVREIEGSSSYSNHSSGTAFDYNAPNHPMGKRNTYSEAKREKIRARLRDRYEGVVRWGGDYTNRPDDMHFEIHGSASKVKAVANKIKAAQQPKPAPEPKEEDVAAFTIEQLLDTEIYTPYDAKRPTRKLREIWGWTPSAYQHQVTQQAVAGLTELVRLQGAQIAKLAAGEELDDAANSRIETLAVEIRDRLNSIPEVPPVGQEPPVPGA